MTAVAAKGPGAPFLHVAVGVVVRQQQVLLSLRASHQHQGGKWEFPGGKVEGAETVLAALGRELQEELAIRIEQASPLMQIRHQYPEREVLLDIWLVEAFSGEPKGMEGQQVAWFDISQLHTLVFPDANQPIVARLQSLFT
ncbi:8-oxo-dGTP diphosphatase MutT [Alkalimonas sp. MEB108]|uniref:8-oxo-dGTP diphosphatase n=1 Tax=Alkalimonas cellulosilytica TaxID=3058395 RepID=A0ABU7J2Y1_9GAMM|nr:8-oxo-dGTP diphosphatase MutT [Alkalimonas sp. MEB108]MEE2000868.1 8-oxo-dGTP diphosphatase MutT [Alkalimonas sp. MEB108]